MIIRQIDIEVRGPVGLGKSHVMKVIRDALAREYGVNVRVASPGLDSELRQVAEEDMVRPDPTNTLFTLSEAVETPRELVMEYPIG